jgi:hypothetical protein
MTRPSVVPGRRLHAAWLVVLLGLAVAGCGDATTDTAADPTPASSTTSTTPSAPTSSDTSPSGGDPTPTDGPSTPGTESTPTPDDAPTATVDLPATLETTSVVFLQQEAGQPQWVASDRQRLLDARWRFDSGSFTFATSNVRTDVYPLTGDYQISGTTVRFSATGQAVNAVGSASARLDGTLDLVTGELRFQWTTSSGMGAVVNGQQFAGATTSAYSGAVRVG